MPSSDVSEPIELNPLPSWAWVLALVVNVPIYVYLTSVRGDSFRGLAGAFAGCVIVLLAIGYWSFRRKPKFWAVLLGVTILHAFLIWSLPTFQYRGPGMVFYPVLVLDIFVCMKLLNSEFNVTDVEEPHRLTSTEILEGDTRL